MSSGTKYSDVGVIVGRFQVHRLTEGHFKLIKMVLDRHKKVIIFLGSSGISPVPSTKRNPLDFEIRKQMLEDAFPPNSLIISQIKDNKFDNIWSQNLDVKIADLVSPNQTVTLYGGRDSFIKHYNGKHTTEQLEPDVYLEISGTELRKELKVKAEASDMFRAGVIWANENQYKHAIAVADVAVFNDDYTKILLGRKEYEKEYRFFGGFVDVTKDSDIEATGKREVKEEAGIEVDGFDYICSALVKDWRFENEGDKVYTTLFAAKYIFGSVKPGDDIVECRWFDFKNITYKDNSELADILVGEHKKLLSKLFKKMEEKCQIKK